MLLPKLAWGTASSFIPGLAYASHDFLDENKHADLRQTTFGRTSKNLPKAAGKWAFLATLESGNILGCGLLRASKGV